MDTSTAEEIARVFAPVGYALHEAMPTAVGRADEAMKHLGMTPTSYPSQYIHNIVGCTHSLMAAADIGTWVLDNNARKKQLHLSRDLWSVRLLASTFDQRVPAAGRNQARQGHYLNPSVTTQTADAALLQQHGFLVIWRIDSMSGELVLELVHTLSTWRWGQAERVDLRMPLVADEADLNNLKFSPAAEDDLEDLGIVDQRGTYQRGAIDGRGASS